MKGRASSAALNAELRQSLSVHLRYGMQSSAGFFIDPPACFHDLPDLENFDRWLESYGADPYFAPPTSSEFVLVQSGTPEAVS